MEQKGEKNYLLKLPGEEHENSYLVQAGIENAVGFFNLFFYFVFLPQVSVVICKTGERHVKAQNDERSFN